jgi:hypothetical protein
LVTATGWTSIDLEFTVHIYIAFLDEMRK